MMSADSRKPSRSTRRKSAREDDETASAKRASRNERQAAYQREYRATLAKARIPSRDDVAAVAFHWFITLCFEKNDDDGLRKIRWEVVRRLVELGFDREGTELRFDDLVKRYKNGWAFQRKPHLGRDRPDDGSD
jgi:hypothetical protein